MLQSITRFWLVSLIVMSLAACGFHLRGITDIPYKSIFLTGNTLVISKDLKQSLQTNKIAIQPTAEGAELQLELIGEENEKRILSLAGSGTVNEYELFYRVHYRTKHENQTTWSNVYTVESRRDYTYSDANLLAKIKEEKQLKEGMQQEVINGMMRRISALKKQSR